MHTRAEGDKRIRKIREARITRSHNAASPNWRGFITKTDGNSKGRAVAWSIMTSLLFLNAHARATEFSGVMLYSRV